MHLVDDDGREVGQVIRAVEVGSIWEETPEGLYRMDSLRMESEEVDRRVARLVTPSFVEAMAKLEDDAFLFGTVDPKDGKYETNG